MAIVTVIKIHVGIWLKSLSVQFYWKLVERSSFEVKRGHDSFLHNIEIIANYVIHIKKMNGKVIDGFI